MSSATLEAPTSLRLACRSRPAVERSVTDDREHRLDRCRKIICVRRSLADDTYENDLKLSIALDRLMDALELC